MSMLATRTETRLGVLSAEAHSTRTGEPSGFSIQNVPGTEPGFRSPISVHDLAGLLHLSPIVSA